MYKVQGSIFKLLHLYRQLSETHQTRLETTARAILEAEGIDLWSIFALKSDDC